MRKQYPCVSGTGCVQHGVDTPAQVPEPSSLCQPCVDDLERKRSELPGMLEFLRVVVGYQPVVVGGARVRSTRGYSLPINVYVFDLIAEMQVFLDAIGESPVREMLGRRYVIRVWHNDECFNTEVSGVTTVLVMRSLWLRAEKVIGLDHVWEARHAPCPRCSGATLGSWSGTGRVDCSDENCRESMTLSEYETYCIVESRKRADG